MKNKFDDMIKLLKASLKSKEREKETVNNSIKKIDKEIDITSSECACVRAEIACLENDLKLYKWYPLCRTVCILCSSLLIGMYLYALNVFISVLELGYVGADLMIKALFPFFNGVIFGGLTFLVLRAICPLIKNVLEYRKLYKKYSSEEEISSILSKKRDKEKSLSTALSLLNADKKGLLNRLNSIEEDISTLNTKMNFTNDALLTVLSSIDNPQLESTLDYAYDDVDMDGKLRELEDEIYHKDSFTIKPKDSQK